MTVIHPVAFGSPWVVIGPGRRLFPGSIINGRAGLGASASINRGPVVEPNCELEDQGRVAV